MSGSTLQQLDLRFEQHCEGGPSALRGKVHWDLGAGLHSVNPVRVLDSRNGTGGYSSPWAPSQTRPVTVAGVTSVPADATAVVLNLTATNSTDLTYVTAWPTGQTMPLASNLNVSAGDTRANLVVVKVGAGGTISLRNDKGTVDLIADVAGYYDATGDEYVATGPSRFVDSRIGKGGPLGAFGPGETRNVTIRGVSGVPVDATAVVANVTAVSASASTYLTVWPSGQPTPLASNLNVPPGDTRPNLVVAKIGSDGKISVRNNLGTVQVVVDVVGYYKADGGLRFYPAAPKRMVDSRSGVGGYATPWHSTESRDIRLVGPGVMPSAQGVVANITGVLPTAPTHVTVWPANKPFPPTSNLNLWTGAVAANAAFVGTTSGFASTYNNAGDVDLVVDVVGYLG
jgi:hypothetical protein